MAFIDQAILTERLQLAGCCISDKADAVMNKLCIGVLCKDDILELKLLTALISIPLSYTPITDEDDDGVINTVTEEELDLVWDKIANLCNICFPVKGSDPSQVSTATTPQLVDENGDILISEAGDILIQEIAPFN